MESFTFDWYGTQAWEPAGNRAVVRSLFVCTRVNVDGATREVVVVAGGANSGDIRSQVELYDVETGDW